MSSRPPARVIAGASAVSHAPDRVLGSTSGCVRAGRLPAAAALARSRPDVWAAAAHLEDCSMTDRTYRVTEIVGTSPQGIEPAITGALHRAAQTLRHLDWFEVTQVRGQIVDGEVAHYQVGLKVGFRLEDA